MPNRTAKIVWGASAVVLAGLVAVAVPALAELAPATGGNPAATKPVSSTPDPRESAPSAAPSAEPAPAAENPCQSARPSITLVQDGKEMGDAYTEGGGRITGMLKGELVDLGPSEYAEGAVTLNDAGEIVSYTVASGDVYELIYKRFCFTDYYDVTTYNSGLEPVRSRPAYKGIEVGDVLILRPDPTVEWLPPSY